jgi:ABC-type sugar transport system substrate-binding protein|nr:substrate-binding domain-containing protein [uncultured Schaedlerella sp.]
MKKRLQAALLAGVLSIAMLAGCGTVDEGTSSPSEENKAQTAKEDDGTVDVVLSLGNASDYYIGTMVGENLQQAFEDAGASVQILDGGDDVANQVNQIQNAVTSGADIIYIFPAGDGPTYYDVLQTARSAGVRTIMSNNYPGEGGADVYVGSDEFQMGVMMSALLSEWADETYPDAGKGEVDVLIAESTFSENPIRRCLGMRLIGEKFLRKCDTASIYYVKEEGDPVTYIDENGKETEVDEPTGGLILDEEGHAQLNPYYNEKINLMEYSNRNSAGTEANEAQNAIENAVTMGGENLKAFISYGDVGAAAETKIRELCADGKIKTDVSKFAVFCSDLTDTNKSLILNSGNDESILRGVMASGDLVQTLMEDAKAMVDGEEPPEFTMEPISYMRLNEAGDDIETVYYTDCPQLPDTEEFFD